MDGRKLNKDKDDREKEDAGKDKRNNNKQNEGDESDVLIKERRRGERERESVCQGLR